MPSLPPYVGLISTTNFGDTWWRRKHFSKVAEQKGKRVTPMSVCVSECVLCRDCLRSHCQDRRTRTSTRERKSANFLLLSSEAGPVNIKRNSFLWDERGERERAAEGVERGE